MKKSFLRILSIAVTLLMIAGMVMMPVSAAVPETGFTSTTRNKVTNTIYRASDAADAVDADGASLAWLSSDSSVWKFAAGALGDTFKPSSEDFAAPKAEAVKGGQIKLSWTAPVEGKATVKVIADGYNKEVVTNASSITLGDTEIGKVYQVQVTVGGKSSEILSYNHIYAPTYVTNSVFKEDYDVASNEKRTYDYMFVNLEKYTDLINSKSGIMVKVNSEIVDDTYKIISYDDNHIVYDEDGVAIYTDKAGNILYKKTDENGDDYYIDADDMVIYADSEVAKEAGVAVKRVGTVSYDNENAATEPLSMSDKNVSIAFHTILQLPIRDSAGGMSAGSAITVNPDATKKSKYFDIHGGALREGRGNSHATYCDDMKNQGFTEGYIFIPFDLLDEASKNTVKEQGVINLNITRQRFYAKNIWENSNIWNWNLVYWSETNHKTNTSKKDINYWFDRQVSLSEVAFISDYDAFFSTCVDTDNLTAGVDYSKLATSSEKKDTVYLNTLTESVLSDSSVASTYTVATNEIAYTTAAGEKMMMGFTAPATEKYDISCPIAVADYANKGVYTRVIKESADGTKTVLQAEAAYNGGRHLALITEELTAGDTVWFEAWANSAATLIELGIPQVATYSNGTYAYYNYLWDLATTTGAKNRYNPKQTNSFIDVGYFLNPFRIDTVTTVTDDTTGETTTSTTEGKIYEMASDSVATAEGTVLVQDMLGISNLKVGDIATTLYNSLKPYEFIRGDINSGLLASDSSCRRVAGLDGAPNNRYGFTGTSTLFSNLQILTNIGYGRSFAGDSTKERYQFNSGAYLRFTAPADGEAKFVFAGGTTASIENVILLHNSTVVSVGTSAEALKDTIVNVKKGDEVIVCLATTANVVTLDIREPKAVFTAAEQTKKTVIFNEETDNLMPALYADGAKITLPAVAKNGAIFEGWNDGTTTYAAGTEYTVNADTEFTAQYIYYGDLDGVGEIAQAADVTVLRKMIIGAAETGATDKANLTGDIDANGTISLVDLVKLKKMSAGIDVTVGAK